MCEEIDTPNGIISTLGELKAQFLVLREDYLDDDDVCPECQTTVDDDGFCPASGCVRFGLSMYKEAASGNPSTSSMNESCLCSVDTKAVLNRAGVTWHRDACMGEPVVTAYPVALGDDQDFHEEDEDPRKIEAIWNRPGKKLRTRKPPKDDPTSNEKSC